MTSFETQWGERGYNLPPPVATSLTRSLHHIIGILFVLTSPPQPWGEGEGEARQKLIRFGYFEPPLLQERFRATGKMPFWLKIGSTGDFKRNKPTIYFIIIK